MYDPPDYPYKELSEMLRDHYGPEDDLLFHNSGSAITEAVPNKDKGLLRVTEEIITNVENQLSFHSNESGPYFEEENTFLGNNTENKQTTELNFARTDNLFNTYEPTLLDDNTVNQFLLPYPQFSSEVTTETDSTVTDLLALRSCVMCHEIFTTDADLLDHTISHHATVDLHQQDQTLPVCNNTEENTKEAGGTNNLNFESEWLVCSICERVLSTALEIEPNEPLCCVDASGKCSVGSRKLQTMYVCEVCSGLFADGDALDRHLQSCFAPETAYVSDNNVMLQELPTSSTPPQAPELCYACDACGERSRGAEEWRRHAAGCPRAVRLRRPYTATVRNKMWNCGSCNQLFSTARELYRHKRGEDRPAGAPLMAYVCEDCDKVLGSMCALHTHKKMHKVTKPGYPCRVCGRRFNQSGHLAIHMRMHTGERPYPCDLCPKAFKVKVERDDHRRTHTGERPFACALCPKTFTAAARLREHARIHTDQRPYRCDICGAAFRRPYARTVHTLIHTGDKPHECDVCGTAFRRSGDMWKHKRTLHGSQAADPKTA